MVAFKDFFKPKTKKHFVNQGTSGTEIFSGYYDEEYLQKIQGMDGADVWDEMRRSDSQVKMLLSVVKNPIMSATWSIESVDNSEEEKFVADFISHVLFDDMGTEKKLKTWMQFIEEALTCVEFGFSLFEIVNKVVVENPRFGSYIGIKEFGFRSQKSIEEWNLNRDGSINNVRQRVDGDLQSDTNIPGIYLMPISINKEGDNYEGISNLRPCYGNWIRKNNFNKIKAIGIEKTAVGTPHGKIPEGQENSPQRAIFEDILQKITTHENAWIASTEGWEIDVLTLDFDPDKVQKVIDAEDVKMSKAFLANFMELGLSGGGSHALGSDMSDIFLSGIEYYANKITEAINHQVIPHLVRCKYGKREKYPKLTVTGINDKAGQEFANVITMLAEKNILTVDDKLEKFVRGRFKLPELDEDAIGREIKPSIPANTAQFKEVVESVQFAETKNRTQTFIEDGSKGLEALMRTSLNSMAEQYIQDITNKVKNTQPSKIRQKVLQLQIKGGQGYRSDVTQFLSGTTEGIAKLTTQEINQNSNLTIKLDEISKDFKNIPPAEQEKLRTEIDLILGTQEADMKKNVLFTFNQRVDALEPEQLEDEMRKSYKRWVGGAVLGVSAVNFVAQRTNATRNRIFSDKDVSSEIESFVFTNSNPKSAICQNLTGRVFRKDDPQARIYLPPLHHNCKSIIVPQFNGTKDNKDISPLGLQPTGTDKQVESILKSKTF